MNYLKTVLYFAAALLMAPQFSLAGGSGFDLSGDGRVNINNFPSRSPSAFGDGWRSSETGGGRNYTSRRSGGSWQDGGMCDCRPSTIITRWNKRYAFRNHSRSRPRGLRVFRRTGYGNSGEAAMTDAVRAANQLCNGMWQGRRLGKLHESGTRARVYQQGNRCVARIEVYCTKGRAGCSGNCSRPEGKQPPIDTGGKGGKGEPPEEPPPRCCVREEPPPPPPTSCCVVHREPPPQRSFRFWVNFRASSTRAVRIRSSRRAKRSWYRRGLPRYVRKRRFRRTRGLRRRTLRSRRHLRRRAPRYSRARRVHRRSGSRY